MIFGPSGDCKKPGPPGGSPRRCPGSLPGQVLLICVAGCPVARSVDPQLLAPATDRLSVGALGVADPFICGCAFAYVARQQVLRERDQAPQR